PPPQSGISAPPRRGDAEGQGEATRGLPRPAAVIGATRAEALTSLVATIARSASRASRTRSAGENALVITSPQTSKEHFTFFGQSLVESSKIRVSLVCPEAYWNLREAECPMNRASLASAIPKRSAPL